jgi:PAS domain S-box-containing protein
MTKRNKATSKPADKKARADDETPGKETQLQAILDHSPNLIFVKDPDGRYLFVNRRFQEVFHLRLDHITRKTDDEVFPPHQAAAFRSNDRAVLAADMPQEFEEVALHDDGPHTSIVFKFPLCDGRGRPYAVGGIATDITDRKRMEQALRESRARLALALEERQRLDADLHDNIIQMLYAVGMNIEQARHVLGHDANAADGILQGSLTHLNQIIADVRHYIGRQDPPHLHGDHLIDTLKDLLHAMQGAQGPQFALRMDPRVTQQLTDEQSVHLYCIAREAISNCFRHAKARSGRLSLQVHGRSIHLEVEDDGTGFESREVAGQGHGLQNIRMRVEKLGGQLHIESVPNRGTRIVAVIPQ